MATSGMKNDEKTSDESSVVEGEGAKGLNRCQTRNTISLIANYKPRERGGVCRAYVIQAYKRFAKIRETLQVCFRDGVVTELSSRVVRVQPPSNE